MNFMKISTRFSLFLYLNMKTDGAKETQTIIGAGGKTMNLKTYTMMVGNLSVTAQVTENGCIPVSESIVGSTPGRQYNLSPILTHRQYVQNLTTCTWKSWKKKYTVVFYFRVYPHGYQFHWDYSWNFWPHRFQPSRQLYDGSYLSRCMSLE